MFVFQKIIDRSSLRQGFQIPVEYHHMLKAMPGGFPVQGETRDIKIFIDGHEFDAQLKNQAFDREKYPDHAEVVQIRYSENSPVAQYLRVIFESTWKYVESIKLLPENINRKFTVKIPVEMQESLALIATETENEFYAEYVTSKQKGLMQDEFKAMDELDFETFIPKIDKTADIREISSVQRIRHLDRSIGDSLKKLYDYRCQMTGDRIGNNYGALVVEAHHIDPFTKSLNNDSSNIIIVSPSYHRIIHIAKPTWDAREHAFRFPNGLIERVKINHHL